MLNTEPLSNHGLRRQHKVTDIPAAITDRNALQKYRANADLGDLRRGSLTLQKPKPPEKDEFRRKSTTSSTVMEVMRVIQKKTSVVDSRYTQSPLKVSTKTSTLSSSSTSASSIKLKSRKSDKSDSVGHQATKTQSTQSATSFSQNRSNNSQITHSASANQLLQMASDPRFEDRGSIYDIDLSYIGPCESLGLFSTSGVTGSKARLGTSGGLRRSGSLQDVGDKCSFTDLHSFKLRRSSSVSNILEDIRASLRAPIKLQQDEQSHLFKDKQSLKQSQNVPSTRRDRPENRNVSSNAEASKSSAKKSTTASKSGNSNTRGAKSNTRTVKSTDPKQKKSEEKVVATRQVEKKPCRRAVITQMVEDGEDEIEVVGYL